MFKEGTFRREYSGAVWRKWWWLVVSGGFFTIVGTIGSAWKAVRVPGLIVLAIGLLAIIVAQYLVAREFWNERNQARGERDEAIRQRDEIGTQVTSAVSFGPGSSKITIQNSPMTMVTGAHAGGNAKQVWTLVEKSPHQHPVIQNQKFENKEIEGPAIFDFTQGVKFEGTTRWAIRNFDDLFYEAADDRELPGVIEVRHTLFRDCTFYYIGIIKTKPPTLPSPSGDGEDK